MKAWYLSKTLWVNFIAAIVLITQTQTGFVIEPEIQGYLLAIVNLALRMITGTELNWKADATSAPTGNGNQAGFIRQALMLSIGLLMCASLLFFGCATGHPATPTSNDTPLQTAGKSLLAAKSSIVTAATATDALCDSDTMASDKCVQAKAAYETAQRDYDTAVDAYRLMSSQGGAH